MLVTPIPLSLIHLTLAAHTFTYVGNCVDIFSRNFAELFTTCIGAILHTET